MPIRPARKLRVVTVLDRAQPELTFKLEPFYVIARELPPLFKRHHRELGRHKEDVPLDPNWDQMMAQSVQGTLRVLTVRDGDDLVGYVFNLVGPHLHYRSTLHGVVDMYYLEPRYRRGLVGLKMLAENERQMELLGVKRLFIGENLSYKNARGRRTRTLFKRLGYRPVDVHYAKLLGD